MRDSLFALIATIAVTLAANTPAAPLTQSDSWRVSRTIHRKDNGDILVFANAKQLELPLNSVRIHGALPRVGKAPILIVSGYGCHQCDDMRNIYYFPADAGRIAAVPPYRHYPGAITSEEDGKPYSFGRLFVGLCGADTVLEVVRYTRMRDTLGKWHAGSTTGRVVGDIILELSDSQPQQRLQALQRAVRAKRCRELQTINQTEW